MLILAWLSNPTRLGLSALQSDELIVVIAAGPELWKSEWSICHEKFQTWFIGLVTYTRIRTHAPARLKPHLGRRRQSSLATEVGVGPNGREITEGQVWEEKDTPYLKVSLVKFNLKLLEERDAELERYDASFTNLKALVRDREIEISELKISAAELRHTISNLGEVVDEDELDDMISDADKDGDGQIDYNEFVNILMNPVKIPPRIVVEEHLKPFLPKEKEKKGE